MAKKPKGDKSQQDQIKDAVLNILDQKPKGLRFSELVVEIEKLTDHKIPRQNINTHLSSISDDKISKPSRGVYILSRYIKKEEVDEVQKYQEEKITTEKGEEIDESDFYPSFAEFLRNDLEECVKAIELGGNKFKDKWGTPDVIGHYTLKGKFTPFNVREIVSAEIKLESKEILTGFGQACSYKLFSHKVYLVVPTLTNENEISRIETLTAKFGIGLVLFDIDPEKPNYRVRNRATKSEPDYFYLNSYLSKLTDDELEKLDIFR